MQPRHVDRARVAREVDRVRVRRALDRDLVGRPVAAAGARAEIDVHLGHVGGREVVDGDEVGAAEGVDIDPLDAVGVHQDGALDAEEPEPTPVGRQVDLLVAGGAVEDHRVGAVLPFDGVAAVTVVSDEGVAAVAHEGHVGPFVSVDRVVAVAAE